MIDLSKEEFMELDAELDENQKTVLQYLAEVYHKNVQNPWVAMKTLGAQIGGITGEAEASVAVQNLELLDLVRYHKRMIAISKKGLAYVKSQSRRYNKKYYLITAFLCVIGIILSIWTGHILYFILGIISSIIAGIIVFAITRQHSI